MAKPQLSNYPALLQVLRNNNQANTEFNAYVSSLRSPGADDARAKEYEQGLEAERIRASEAEARARKAEELNSKAVRFIKLLGEAVESQLKLRPFSQDVLEKSRYEISLTPSQTRIALRWYWDVISSKMEEAIAKGAQDPIPNEDEST